MQDLSRKKKNQLEGDEYDFNKLSASATSRALGELDPCNEPI